jgi:hypothetical protein
MLQISASKTWNQKGLIFYKKLSFNVLCLYKKGQQSANIVQICTKWKVYSGYK